MCGGSVLDKDLRQREEQDYVEGFAGGEKTG